MATQTPRTVITANVVLAGFCVLIAVLGAIPTAATAANAPRCFGKPATIVGTRGDDRLLGTPRRDVIVGLGGADEIFGRGRGDRVCGKGGSDFISGGQGNDRIATGPGNNGLSGDAGDDVLQGGSGPDDNANYVLSPRPISASIKGGFARGQGHDKLKSGIDELFGSEHDDTLIGDKRPQLLAGFGGDDVLRGGRRDDLLAGGAGDDRIDGGRGPFDLLDDFEFGGPGTGGPERLNLATGILRGNGTDHLSRVNGTVGTDADDHLVGGPGQDILLGNVGDDSISGQGGGDLLEGGEGVDDIDGGSGSDYLSYFDFPTPITVDISAGTATGPNPAKETDTFTDVKDVLAGPHDDTLIGDDTANVLRGDVGGDTILGAGGDDTLLADCFGGGGEHITFEFHFDCSSASNPDTLDGGDGTDKCRDGETVSGCEREPTGHGQRVVAARPRLEARRSQALTGAFGP